MHRCDPVFGERDAIEVAPTDSRKESPQSKGGVEMRDQTGSNNPNWKGGITGKPESLRANKASYRARHRDRHLAHKAVQTAVARGKLKRGACEVCGEEGAHAHHDDYSKRLDVRWFCKRHHQDAHRLE